MRAQMAYWFGFAAVAGAFGGLIAFGIQHVHAHIQNWRLLFIVEVCCPQKSQSLCISTDSGNQFQGIPAILLGIMTAFYLPNRPESTTFFNERERKLAVERMNRHSSGDTGATVNKGMEGNLASCGAALIDFPLAHIRMALKDWRVRFIIQFMT